MRKKSMATKPDYIPTLRDIRKRWRRTREGRKSGITEGTGELRSYIAATTFSSTLRLETLKEKIGSMKLGRPGQKIHESLVALYGEVELLSLLADFSYNQTKKP